MDQLIPGRRAALLALGAALVSLTAVGCGGTAPTKTVKPASAGPSAAETASPTAFPLPLDAYRYSDQERIVLEKASDQLTNECMANFGFGPIPVKRNPEATLAQARYLSERYFGLNNLAEAKVTGYRLKPEFNQPRPKNSVSDTYRYVLTGTKSVSEMFQDNPKSPGNFNGKPIPAGGCMAEVRLKLYGSRTAEQKQALATQLTVQAQEIAAADQRVLSYQADWSRCLEKRGYRAKTSTELQEKFDPGATGAPTQAEIQTATADVECKQSTNLVRKWYAVVQEQQQKLLEKNQLQLTEERKVQTGELDRAAKVIAAN